MVTIEVNPHHAASKPRPTIVSLGPVLEDSFFRVLIETKPELSETFYRRLSDFSSALDVPAAAPPRYGPGDVVSMPDRRFGSSLRGMLSGEKQVPVHEFTERMSTEFEQKSFDMEKELEQSP